MHPAPARSYAAQEANGFDHRGTVANVGTSARRATMSRQSTRRYTWERKMKRYHATLTGVLTAAMFASAVALTVGAHSALAQADPSVNELVERLTPKPGQADSGALDRFRKFDFRQVRPEDREWLQTRPNTDLYITFDFNSARM